MKPTSNLVNPNLPTVSMPGMNALVHFLAKIEKGTPSPFRYGNRTQAEAKRESLADRLAQEGSSSAVVPIGSRFLIAIFPAEYDLDQKSSELVRKFNLATGRVSGAFQKLGEAAGKAARNVQRFNEAKSRRLPFATVTGPRIDPRSRHNQNGAGPVYCRQGSRFDKPEPVLYARWTKNRRQQYRAVSDRLNAAPERGPK